MNIPGKILQTQLMSKIPNEYWIIFVQSEISSHVIYEEIYSPVRIGLNLGLKGTERNFGGNVAWMVPFIVLKVLSSNWWATL